MLIELEKNRASANSSDGRGPRGGALLSASLTLSEDLGVSGAAAGAAASGSADVVLVDQISAAESRALAPGDNAPAADDVVVSSFSPRCAPDESFSFIFGNH